MKHYQATPGVYLSLLPRDSALPPLPGAVLESPIVGVHKRTQWRDFSTGVLGADLDACARQGLRLILMLEDKTFADGANPLPAEYVDFAPLNVAGGRTALRWANPIRSAFRELVVSIYREFGSHLAFEGIALQETALGLDTITLEGFGYSPGAYADTYVELVQAVSDVQPGTVRRPAKRIFWYANFFAGKPAVADAALASVIERCDDTLAFGTPDCCLVDSMSVTAKPLLERVYPRFAKFPDSTKFVGFSLPAQTQPGIPLEQAVDFARSELLVDYEFWVYNAKRWPAAVEAMQR